MDQNVTRIELITDEEKDFIFLRDLIKPVVENKRNDFADMKKRMEGLVVEENIHAYLYTIDSNEFEQLTQFSNEMKEFKKEENIHLVLIFQKHYKCDSFGFQESHKGESFSTYFMQRKEQLTDDTTITYEKLRLCKTDIIENLIALMDLGIMFRTDKPFIARDYPIYLQDKINILIYIK